MIKFVTFNVNSLRARFLHLQDLVFRESPDFIMLQEVRCDESKLAKDELENLGYNIACSLFGGRNGVMLMSKHKIEDFYIKFPQPNIDKNYEKFSVANINEGRYIEGYFVIDGKSFCVCSGYFPNGGNSVQDEKLSRSIEESERFNYKLAFYDDIINHSKNLLTKADYVIIGGDYNVARHAIDLYNPKYFAGLPCFHPLETKRFQQLIDIGYIDYFRAKNPSDSQYTWWNYMRNGYAQNKGLRIDYILTSPSVENLIANYQHLYYYRELEKPSDHCPVLLEINN